MSQGGNSTTITLRDTSGTFIRGEEIRINDNVGGATRTITAVQEFSIRDIKSVYQNAAALGLQGDFSADLVLNETSIDELGPGDEVNISGSNVMTCAGKAFSSLRVGDIIIVNLTTDGDPRFIRICSISADKKSVTLSATTNVSGVCVGTVLASATPTGVKLGIPAIKNENTGLFAQLQEKNVTEVEIRSSE